MARIPRLAKVQVDAHLMKSVSHKYLDQIEDSVIRADVFDAIEFVRYTVDQFYSNMKKSDNYSKLLVGIVMNSEKAVKIDGADLLEVSKWLDNNSLKPQMIMLEELDSYGFVFDTRSDAIKFMLKWVG